MKKSTVILLAVVLCAIGFFAGRGCQSGVVIPNSEEVVDSTTTETTIPDTAPVPRDSVVIKYIYETIPITPPPEASPNDSVTAPVGMDSVSVSISGDSAIISLPITQTKYENDEYRAYVSGYKAKLDSIFVHKTVTTVRIREPTKQKRFSIGLQAGYGMTPKGFQPYVGVGVSVNLWSF